MSEAVAKNSNKKTRLILVGVALGMLGLGFASKPLYDTFCRVTGYGGTPKVAESNESEILDRLVTVNFDSNVAPDLPWEFTPEQREMTINVGQSGLAFYKVKNLSDEPIVGTATFNVTPMKSAPYFIKTECFCFTEQLIKPGESMTMPVLFHVDSQIDEEERLKDIKDITLSYTFFRVKNPQTSLTEARASEDKVSGS